MAGVPIRETAAAAAARRRTMPRRKPITKAPLNEFIDREINMRMTKSVTWKNLESCFKWARVQEYLSEQDIDVDDPVVGRLRGMLKANQLINVQYSTRTRKILKLNTENL